MDYQLSSELQPHLDHQETLLWTGQPRRGIIFRTTDIYVIPFSILWCGFAIFWFASALKSGAPLVFSLFGVPFVLIGLVFVFGRFIIDAKQREHTFYGLTADRIIIKSGIFRKSVKSLNIRTLSDIEYTEKADGSGTITIGPRNFAMYWASGMDWWPGLKVNPALDNIPEVRKVYNKIIELQRTGR